MERTVLAITPKLSLDGQPPQYVLRPTYRESLASAGLKVIEAPANISPSELVEFYHQSAGLFLCGGTDINPVIYGQMALESTDAPDEERDRLEYNAALWAVEDRKPLFGVCRGAQMLAVALHGSLIQEIPGHRTSSPAYIDLCNGVSSHAVSIEEGTRVHEAYQAKSMVWNTMHHQAVDPATLPKSLRISARSAQDDVIEAIEVVDHPFAVGMQSHPEAQEKYRAIFGLFAQAVFDYANNA